jgi:hypothetical protein
MAALTRKESEERQQAVLNYFMANPLATGDEAQRALVSGQLTGKKTVPMGIGMLFRLKRQAEQLLKSGTAQVAAIKPMAPEQAAPILAELREAAARLQKVLAKLPEVAEVRVSRADVIVTRTVVQEERL